MKTLQSTLDALTLIALAFGRPAIGKSARPEVGGRWPQRSMTLTAWVKRQVGGRIEGSFTDDL